MLAILLHFLVSSGYEASAQPSTHFSDVSIAPKSPENGLSPDQPDLGDCPSKGKSMSTMEAGRRCK